MAAHFFLFKFAPFALIFDHETLKHVRVRHLERRKERIEIELITKMQMKMKMKWIYKIAR